VYIVPFFHEIGRCLADLEKNRLFENDRPQTTSVLFLIVCHLSIADPVGTASLSDPDLYQFQPNVKNKLKFFPESLFILSKIIWYP
jgi:hypothetical protein